MMMTVTIRYPHLVLSEETSSDSLVGFSFEWNSTQNGLLRALTREDFKIDFKLRPSNGDVEDARVSLILPAAFDLQSETEEYFLI